MINISFYNPYHNSYHLEVLCTKEDHRCKGAGTALVQWGIDNASKDGAVVGTEPSDGAEEFYKNRGFIKVGHLTMSNPAEPDTALGVPVVRFSEATKQSLVIPTIAQLT